MRSLLEGYKKEKGFKKDTEAVVGLLFENSILYTQKIINDLRAVSSEYSLAENENIENLNILFLSISVFSLNKFKNINELPEIKEMLVDNYFKFVKDLNKSEPISEVNQYVGFLSDELHGKISWLEMISKHKDIIDGICTDASFFPNYIGDAKFKEIIKVNLTRFFVVLNLILD